MQNPQFDDKQSHVLKHSRLRRYFWSGLAIVLPVYATIYLVVIILNFLDNVAGHYINYFLVKTTGYEIPGIGIVLAVILIVLIGRFCEQCFIVPWLDQTFSKLPLVSKIYPTIKQFSDFVFNVDRNHQFQKVIIVEFPYPGSYALGFVTNENMEAFGEFGKDRVCVYLPLVPTPFTGFNLVISKDKIWEVNISIDQALKFVISGGVVF